MRHAHLAPRFMCFFSEYFCSTRWLACYSFGLFVIAIFFCPFFSPFQVDKLRKDNDNLKKSNESLRRERQYEKQKALSTYEASGMSYHALNQTVKALSLSKQKLTAEVS